MRGFLLLCLLGVCVAQRWKAEEQPEISKAPDASKAADVAVELKSKLNATRQAVQQARHELHWQMKNLSSATSEVTTATADLEAAKSDLHDAEKDQAAAERKANRTKEKCDDTSAISGGSGRADGPATELALLPQQSADEDEESFATKLRGKLDELKEEKAAISVQSQAAAKRLQAQNFLEAALAHEKKAADKRKKAAEKLKEALEHDEEYYQAKCGAAKSK